MKFTNWKAFKKAWLKALRSGRYVQGRNRLVDDGDNFCCLGVAANVLIEHGHNGKWFKDEFGHWAFGTEASHCNGTLAYTRCTPRWLKQKLLSQSESTLTLIDDVEAHLMSMNDKGASFEKIAKWIEENL